MFEKGDHDNVHGTMTNTSSNIEGKTSVAFLAAFTAGLRVDTRLPPRSNSADFGVYEPALSLSPIHLSLSFSFPACHPPSSPRSPLLSLPLPLSLRHVESSPRPARLGTPPTPTQGHRRCTVVDAIVAWASGGRSLSDTSVPLAIMAPLPIGDPFPGRASRQSNRFPWAGNAARRMSELRLFMHAYRGRMGPVQGNERGD